MPDTLNQTPEQSPTTSTKGVLQIGLFEIFFVIVAIVLFFGILNFFNIISLSTIYPKQLGWLPHKSSLNSQSAQPQGSSSVEGSLASENQISAYTTLAKSIPFFNAPRQISDQGKNWEVDGIFAGYDPGSKSLQLVGKTGLSQYVLSDNTSFSIITVSNTVDPSIKASASADQNKIRISHNYSINDIIQKIPLGGIIQVYYTYDNSKLNITKVIYYPEYKF